MDNTVSDDFNDVIVDIHENKYILGLMTIIIVIGSRFIIHEIPDIHKEILTHNKVLRKIFLFSILFMATRDFAISFVLTVILSFMFLLLNHDTQNIKKDEKKEPTPEMIKIKTSPQLSTNDNKLSINSM